MRPSGSGRSNSSSARSHPRCCGVLFASATAASTNATTCLQFIRTGHVQRPRVNVAVPAALRLTEIVQVYGSRAVPDTAPVKVSAVSFHAMDSTAFCRR